jgi:hypothetical protein
MGARALCGPIAEFVAARKFEPRFSADEYAAFLWHKVNTYGGCATAVCRSRP